MWASIGHNQMLAADSTTGAVRRFLTGPAGCEVTSMVARPDLTTLFLNIQHPGEPPKAPSPRGQCRAHPLEPFDEQRARSAEVQPHDRARISSSASGSIAVA